MSDEEFEEVRSRQDALRERLNRAWIVGGCEAAEEELEKFADETVEKVGRIVDEMQAIYDQFQADQEDEPDPDPRDDELR